MPPPDLDPADWLPSRANFIRERAEEERTNGIAWFDGFSPRFGGRIMQIFTESYPSAVAEWDTAVNDDLLDLVTNHSQYGTSSRSLHEAFNNMWGSVYHEQVDWLAAVPLVLARYEANYAGTEGEWGDNTFTLFFNTDDFVERTNDLLLDERVNLTFIDSRLRPRENEPLHTDLMQPTEAFLSNDERFSTAETAYMEASSSLAAGHYGQAITAAASALQDTLRAFGATGQTLASQINSARSRNLIMAHDAKLFEMVKMATDWLTADRSNRGNAHGASSATRADAQLAIHIAASIMLRLMRLEQSTSVEATEPPEPRRGSGAS